MDKISVRNLTKIYGSHPDRALALLNKGLSNEEIRKQTRQVVGIRNIDFSVAAGESFVIMGLSGSGKSTLLRCINCLIEATRGEILIDGGAVAKR